VHGRYYKPGDVGVVYRRSGTPPLQRGASPLQLTRSPPGRTPSPAQGMSLRAEALQSPALRSGPSVGVGSPQRSPSPFGRLIVSPARVTQQLALWPPRRPVGRVLVPPAVMVSSPPRLPEISSPAFSGSNTQDESQSQPSIPTTAEHLAAPARVSEDSFSPERFSDFDASYREVSSNDTTAVSPTTPANEDTCSGRGPQGPPPPRPVRCSATERNLAALQRRQEDFLRELSAKDGEIASLRAVASTAAADLEVARLRLTCVVCSDADVQCIFQPCHHVVCCQECASQCRMCPICRRPVLTTSAVYLP